MMTKRDCDGRVTGSAAWAVKRLASIDCLLQLAVVFCLLKIICERPQRNVDSQQQRQSCVSPFPPLPSGEHRTRRSAAGRRAGAS